MIIIGGGAAGLAAAQYAARSNLKALVIEEKGEGGQAVLIDKLENYPGIAEPVSGYEWSVTMKKQATDFGAEFTYGKVTGLGKKDGLFSIPVEHEGEEPTIYQARTVLLATGADHRKLGVPGEKEFYGKGVSYCATCDGPFFRNKHIVVVGGGDAACDEANFLSHLTDRVTMIHRKDKFRAQKALVARTLANPHIKVLFNTVITEIRGTEGPGGKVTSVVLETVADGKSVCPTGENAAKGDIVCGELACDAVFIFVGMDPRTELASLAKQDDSGYIITDELMRTSIPGLFAAGDIRAKPFRQIITAASDGAIAAHAAAACIDEQQCEARA
jgi:thioredoxin reductase (NADPH)